MFRFEISSRFAYDRRMEHLSKERTRLADQRSYLILRGHGGSGPEHWQTWLYDELSRRGETVYYPQFPDPEHPAKSEWIHMLEQELTRIPAEEEITVVTHSLSCILWFHYACGNPMRKVTRALLVAPVSPVIEFEPVATFFPIPGRLEGLSQAAESTLIVMSSNDPHGPLAEVGPYLDAGVPCLVLPKQGHLNTASGYGPWPWILDECMTPHIR